MTPRQHVFRLNLQFWMIAVGTIAFTAIGDHFSALLGLAMMWPTHIAANHWERQ